MASLVKNIQRMAPQDIQESVVPRLICFLIGIINIQTVFIDAHEFFQGSRRPLIPRSIIADLSSRQFQFSLRCPLIKDFIRCGNAVHGAFCILYLVAVEHRRTPAALFYVIVIGPIHTDLNTRKIAKHTISRVLACALYLFQSAYTFRGTDTVSIGHIDINLISHTERLLCRQRCTAVGPAYLQRILRNADILMQYINHRLLRILRICPGGIGYGIVGISLCSIRTVVVQAMPANTEICPLRKNGIPILINAHGDACHIAAALFKMRILRHSRQFSIRIDLIPAGTAIFIGNAVLHIFCFRTAFSVIPIAVLLQKLQKILAGLLHCAILAGIIPSLSETNTATVALGKIRHFDIMLSDHVSGRISLLLRNRLQECRLRRLGAIIVMT